MSNPLYDMINGHGPIASQAAPTPSNNAQMNMMEQLRANPAQMMRQAGYNVPDDIAGDPQASVMHLIQSGQVGGQMMQRIRPMLNMLMGRR